MRKHTYTPGPWMKDGSHIYAHDGEIIAQVRNPGRKASDYPLEANRDLMAAAPDLLWALIDLCTSLDAINDPQWKGSPDEVAARAAIAKATGEQ
jgi:hypothetical protein